MAAPPEHIRIKRRREEEPVETLYIQSDLHQSKRRFTDYVFQRVVRSEGASPAETPHSDGEGGEGTRKSIKSPRAVSSGPSSPAVFGAASRGVPVIRTTAPGDEVKDSRARLASKGGVTPQKDATARAVPGAKNVVPKSSPAFPLRRFHISAPATEAEDRDLAKFLHKGSGGVQKRKGTKQTARAVVVEKLAHTTSGPKVVSALDELASKIGNVTVSSDVREAVAAKQDVIASTGAVKQLASPPRKRHVINEAEKRWKTENKTNRHGDRMQHAREADGQKKVSQSMYDDPSSWDQNSEQLASELEQFALQMTGDVAPSPSVVNGSSKPPYSGSPSPSPIKQKLKYQPHTPKGGRQHGNRMTKPSSMRLDGSPESDEEVPMDIESSQPSAEHGDVGGDKQSKDVSMEDSAEDNDDSFVYDEFIRRPVHELRNDPRAAHLLDGQPTGLEGVAPRDVGVVVITAEDVHYWDALAESDDEGKGWDSEDEDSNAEDNPANEYPDEDLEFDDEYDDTNAAYRQYRHNASDDEEFDVNEYDEYAYGTHCGYGDDSEGDDYDR